MEEKKMVKSTKEEQVDDKFGAEVAKGEMALVPSDTRFRTSITETTVAHRYGHMDQDSALPWNPFIVLRELTPTITSREINKTTITNTLRRPIQMLFLLWLTVVTAAVSCPPQLYDKTNIIVQPVCAAFNPKCCLPDPLIRVGALYAPYIIRAFETGRRHTSARYGFQDLFHGHLITTATHDLVLLIHTAEYPSLVSTGVNLGYCQRGSTISAHAPSYQWRNILVNLATGDAEVLDCLPPLCIRYAEEFGDEVAQVHYMPPILQQVYATPVLCHLSSISVWRYMP